MARLDVPVGGAGEDVARSGRLILAILGNVHEQAWKDHRWSLAAALLGTRRVPGRRGCLGRLRAGGWHSRRGGV